MRPKSTVYIHIALFICSLSIVPIAIGLYQLSSGGIAGGETSNPFIPYLFPILIPLSAAFLLSEEYLKLRGHHRENKYKITGALWVLVAIFSVPCFGLVAAYLLTSIV